MAKPELPAVESTPIVPFQAQRMARILSNPDSPRYRARTFTFYREADPETEQRTQLNPLAAGISSILLDPEGTPYLLIWHQTKGINAQEYVIFGPRQKWRDYRDNPPKKIFQKLTFSQFPLGLEGALRAAETIRDRNRPIARPEAVEVNQMVAALERLRGVLVQRSRFRDLTPSEFDKIIEDNWEFSYAQRLNRARNPQKQRIHQMFTRGFYDSEGRKSSLAADSRAFSLELNIRRRLESTRPILTKFATISEILNFERTISRLQLEHTRELLENLSKKAIFADPEFSQRNPREIRDAATSVRWNLGSVTIPLYYRLRLRPYVLGARKVLEHLGGMPLPDGTISRKLQQKREENKIPTFLDHLQAGNYVEAKAILEQCQAIIQRVLDANADYQTVKKGVRSKSRRKR